MKALKALVAFLALALAANLATVAALPYLIHAYVMHRLVQHVGGYNRALAAPPADASARSIVRPSPDLLYTACAFDVSARPLRLTAPAPDSYLSISGFTTDTSNFFAIDDAALAPGPEGRKAFDLVLAMPGAAALPQGARILTAPAPRGLILFRMLVPDAAALPRLQSEFQSRQRCEPL